MKALFLIFLFVCTDCFAFSCVCKRKGINYHFLHSDIVFSGIVIHSDTFFKDRSSLQECKLLVDNIYKGSGTDTIVIRSYIGECGFRLNEDQSYLIYAYLYQGYYHISTCSSTKLLAEADVDIEFFKHLPGSLYTSGVAGYAHYYADNTMNENNLPVIPYFSFILQSDSLRYDVTTDSSGIFILNNVVPGFYKVKSNEKYAPINSWFSPTVSISDSEVIIENFLFANRNVIKGMVTDADGLPVKVGLDLVTADDGYPDFFKVSKESGEFIMENIPDGKYYLGVNITDHQPPPWRPYLPAYYKNDSGNESASVIELRDGNEISGINITLSKTVTFYTIICTLKTPEEGLWDEAYVSFCKTKDSKQNSGYTSKISSGIYEVLFPENTKGWLVIIPSSIKSPLYKALVPEPIRIQDNKDYDTTVIIQRDDAVSKNIQYSAPSLSGRVYFYKSNSSENTSTFPVMKNFRFRIYNDNQSYLIHTDSSGSFYMDSVSPGSYLLALDSTSEFAIHRRTMSLVDLWNGNKNRDIYITYTNKISGIVIDPEDAVPVNMKIDLVPENYIKGKTPYYETYTVITDVKGTFSFNNIPGGRYLLGVNILKYPAAENPYLTTFYKNDSDSKQAAILEVIGENNINNIELRIGKKIPVFIISGRVVDSYGKPWKEADIKFIEDNPVYGTYPPTPDSFVSFNKTDGSFEHKTLSGGWLYIDPLHSKEREIEWWQPVKPETVKIDSGKDYSNLVIKIDLNGKDIFFVPGENYPGYDTLKYLFQEWVQYSTGFTDGLIPVTEMQKPTKDNYKQFYTFYPDGKVIIYISDKIIEMRWALSNNNPSELYLMSPQNDPILNWQIIRLKKDFIELDMSSHIVSFSIGEKDITVSSSRNGRLLSQRKWEKENK